MNKYLNFLMRTLNWKFIFIFDAVNYWGLKTSFKLPGFHLYLWQYKFVFENSKFELENSKMICLPFQNKFFPKF